MYETITDDFIITTIGTYKQEAVLIEGKILAIQDTLSDDTDLIAAASFPVKDPDVPHSENGTLPDLDDIYRKYVSIAKVQREDCAVYVQQLYEKKDSMDRVMASYSVLPEREKQVLSIFCKKIVRHGIQRALLETEHALYLSERSVQRIRKSGLAKIRELYESDRTLLDLQMEAVDTGFRKQEALYA